MKPKAKEAVKSVEPKKPQGKMMKLKKVETKKAKKFEVKQLYSNEDIIEAASKKVADEERAENLKEVEEDKLVHAAAAKVVSENQDNNRFSGA